MTPQERAKAIAAMLKPHSDLNEPEILKYIAAQIEEAVLDAFDNKWKKEHKRCLEIEALKSWNAAKEKAKGIAETEGNCGATFPNEDDCDCGTEIADCIGKMEPDSTSEGRDKVSEEKL